VPFASNQSPFATTVGDAALGLAPPLPCSHLREEGYTNVSPPARTRSIDFTSFDQNDFTLPFYPMRMGTFPISDHNTLNTQSERDICSADTEWPLNHSDQEQPSQPSIADPSTSLSLRRRALAQKEPAVFGLPEAASPSHLASQSPSTSSVAAVTGSVSSALQLRHSLTRRTNQQRPERHRCTQRNCPATFGRGVDFRRHMRTVHQLGGGGDYRCLVGLCDYQNPRSDKVRSHMAEVHGVRIVTA
jgi:hypothetical protein